jgi:uncharacterized protein DUF4383
MTEHRQAEPRNETRDEPRDQPHDRPEDQPQAQETDSTELKTGVGTGTGISEDDERTPELRQRVQDVTIAVAAVFVLVGILGFIPKITTNFDARHAMRFSGHRSHAMLFGLFMVSVFHNGVHLAYGVVGAVCSFARLWSVVYLLLGGAVYLALWIYGLVIDQGSAANFVPVNTADNWLHFGLGVGMIALGLVFRGSPRDND